MAFGLYFADWKFGNSLGTVGKYPRGSMAFKWRDTVEKTILREIEWSVGKTGEWTPVAVFDPVELEGTTVTRASVHNRDMLAHFRLTVGDSIGVYKANMIIPQIAQNFDYDKHPNYVAPMPPVNDVNVANQMAIRRLMHFASRDAMNIVGFAESNITTLFNAGLLREPRDFYTLASKRPAVCAAVCAALGCTQKGYEKLCLAIDASRDTTQDKFLYALCIPQVGRTASKAICKYLGGHLEMLCKAEVLNKITDISDIGPVIQKNLYAYFTNNACLEEFMQLYRYMRFKVFAATNTAVQQGQVQGSGKIAGKTFVVTGSVNCYKNRQELQDEIESLGGKVASSVSKNTDYLINNDVNSTSGKNAKTKQLGVPIISEEMYRAMR